MAGGVARGRPTSRKLTSEEWKKYEEARGGGHGATKRLARGY